MNLRTSTVTSRTADPVGELGEPRAEAAPARLALHEYFKKVLVAVDCLPAKFAELGRAAGILEAAAAMVGVATPAILAEVEMLATTRPRDVPPAHATSCPPSLPSAVSALLAEQLHVFRGMYQRFDAVAPTRRAFVEEAVKARVESDADSVEDACALGRAAGLFVGVALLLDRDPMALFDEIEAGEVA